MKVDPSVETYQVGAHFKALIKAILVAPSRILEKYFSFHVSQPCCAGTKVAFFYNLVMFSREKRVKTEKRLEKGGFFRMNCL